MSDEKVSHFLYPSFYLSDSTKSVFPAFSPAVNLERKDRVPPLKVPSAFNKPIWSHPPLPSPLYAAQKDQRQRDLGAYMPPPSRSSRLSSSPLLKDSVA